MTFSLSRVATLAVPSKRDRATPSSRLRPTSSFLALLALFGVFGQTDRLAAQDFAFDTEELAVHAPTVAEPVPVVIERGTCDGETVLSHHDGTFEGAYAWSFGGVSAPNYGAFAEGFTGDASICEVQFFLAQLGQQNGQTMDVYVWEDTGTDDPGAVLAVVPAVDPGPIATWPNVSQHNVSISASVSGDWWVGYWGDWSDQAAGWFLAGDESGAPGRPRTNVAPGNGNPTGWYHPNTIFGWESARSLGIQVVTGDAPADAPDAPYAGPDAGPLSGIQTIAPNPFRDSVSIDFTVPGRGPAQLDVYSVTGRHVSKLESGHFEHGLHQTQWDGRDSAGRSQPAGIYLVRLTTDEESSAQRVTLAR